MKKLKLSTIIFAILILIGVYCCTSKKSKPKNQTPNKTYVISTKTENEKLTINIMMENPKDETKQKDIDK